MAESVERIGSLIRVVRAGQRGPAGPPGPVAGSGQFFMQVTPPTVPGPWTWYELDPDTGQLVDIHIAGVGETA